MLDIKRLLENKGTLRQQDYVESEWTYKPFVDYNPGAGAYTHVGITVDNESKDIYQMVYYKVLVSQVQIESVLFTAVTLMREHSGQAEKDLPPEVISRCQDLALDLLHDQFGIKLVGVTTTPHQSMLLQAASA